MKSILFIAVGAVVFAIVGTAALKASDVQDYKQQLAQHQECVQRRADSPVKFACPNKPELSDFDLEEKDVK
jgi:hypothetical protein